jgi:ring-1,2-phenylacetyl-CoA epoxidase subunit PaaD
MDKASVWPVLEGVHDPDIPLISVVELKVIQNVEVEALMDPPWTTDRVSPTGREKLRMFGLASAPIHADDVKVVLFEPATCPNCGTQDIVLKNGFGPTACRSFHFNHCRQPFEAIKPI